MQLSEEIIKKACKSKGITIKQLCKDIGLTEPSLYRFFNNGGMRVSTEKKIKDYLGLNESESTVDVKFNEVVTPVNSGVESNLVDRLLKRIEELSIENFRLREKLGKHDSTLFALSA